MASEGGHLSGARRREGASATAAGMGRFMHSRQNAVKTRYGCPAWLATVHGSKRRLPLKLSACKPRARRSDFTCLSRAMAAGS